MPASILECEKLEKVFSKKRVLDSLSLKVTKGETLGLVGKSGCGKSTLLKCLIGYNKVDNGKILFNDKDITKNLQLLRTSFGYTTQDNSFYMMLTAKENMLYYARLYKLNKKYKNKLKEHIGTILKSVGLTEHADKLAMYLSGGQKRRLDFAISLLHDPQVLILDEPTTGLDPLLVEQFWDVVSSVKKNGKTIIVSSHILSELEENCDRVAIMDLGKIKKILEKKDFSGGKLTRNIRELLGGK